MKTEPDSKTILILQGGSALGAYECGVFEALLPQINDLAVVAGTSIGALNASVIARHYRKEDGGKGALTALKRLWTEKLVNPPWRFPIPSDELRRINARIVGMLGHPHLYAARPSCELPWLAASGAVWADVGFSDTWPLEAMLGDPGVFGSYGRTQQSPRLLITAVDIEAGTSKAFDSRHERITPEKVAACCSLPPNFVPKVIVEGEKTSYYWDGGIWNNTPLRDVLNALQQPGAGTEQEVAAAYDVYIVDVFHKHGPVPRNLVEVYQRKFELDYADKTDYEVKVCGWLNKYLDFVTDIERYAETLPPEYRTELEGMLQRNAEYGGREGSAVQNRFHLDITTIHRSDSPSEQDELLSSAADFSPERIEELMIQGRKDTRNALRLKSDRAVKEADLVATAR